MGKASRLLAMLIGLCIASQLAAGPRINGLQVYRLPAYELHTDLGVEDTKEVAVRMTAMAGEYARRTRGFSRGVPKQMPFYLFATLDGYHGAGGVPGSAGLYDPNEQRLMAYYAKTPGQTAWNVIQHEGFHQFAHHAIGELPPWLNEGLAEYFGESLYCGDMFVSGLVPPHRLERVQKEIQAGAFASFEQMMTMSLREWNMRLKGENYDQAWTMVHFLVHAEEGKYLPTFEKFIRLTASGRPYVQAWRQTFGSADGFEEAWRNWWLAQSVEASDALYAKATVGKLTSFLVRALAAGESYESFDAFLAAAKAGEVAKHVPDTLEGYLPPRLLEEAMAETAELLEEDAKFELIPSAGLREPTVLRLTTADGAVLEGRVELRGKRIKSVELVEVGERD